ncbi:MAG: hypothetical protein WBI18_03535 [Candidatus Saccharicenans sp.]
MAKLEYLNCSVFAPLKAELLKKNLSMEIFIIRFYFLLCLHQGAVFQPMDSFIMSGAFNSWP